MISEVAVHFYHEFKRILIFRCGILSGFSFFVCYFVTETNVNTVDFENNFVYMQPATKGWVKGGYRLEGNRRRAGLKLCYGIIL
jgi:hypothetical protein